MSKSIYYTALITERLEVNRIGHNHSEKTKTCNQHMVTLVKPEPYKLKGGCLLFVLANNINLTDRLKYLGRNKIEMSNPEISGKITR